eukprot:991526-Amphidinium_carterae.1
MAAPGCCTEMAMHSEKTEGSSGLLVMLEGFAHGSKGWLMWRPSMSHLYSSRTILLAIFAFFGIDLDMGGLAH